MSCSRGLAIRSHWLYVTDLKNLARFIFKRVKVKIVFMKLWTFNKEDNKIQEIEK